MCIKWAGVADTKVGSNYENGWAVYFIYWSVVLLKILLPEILNKMYSCLTTVVLRFEYYSCFPLYLHLYYFKVLRFCFMRSGNRGIDVQYPTRNQYLKNFRLPKVNISQFRQSLQCSGPRVFLSITFRN